MIILKLTCTACPEQYDAYDDQNGMEMVGYIRLRNGHFRVDFPDCGGELLFEERGIADDGMFAPENRDHYLRLAVDAIERRIKFGKRIEPDGKNVQYKIEGAQPGRIW